MGFGAIVNSVVSKTKALNPIPKLVAKAQQATSQISAYAKAIPSPKQVLNQVEKTLKPVAQSIDQGLDKAKDLAHQAADKTQELVHDGVHLATQVKDEVDRLLGPIDLAKTALGLGKMLGGGALAYGSIVNGLGLCVGSEVGGGLAALPSGGTSVVGAQFACGAGLSIATAGSLTGYTMMMSGAEDLKNSRKPDELKSKSGDMAHKVNLQKSLASQQQMNEVGKVIAGGNSPTKLRAAEDLSKKYGGKASDWVKKTSSSYNALDGLKMETHWYENLDNGLRVEFKTKLNR